MATSYIHNAVYSPDSAPSTFLPHRRNDSGATTLQGSSDCSQPTEPLLQHYSSEPATYFDLSPRQLPNTGGSRTARRSIDGDSVNMRDAKVLHEHIAKRRLRRLLWYKSSLEVLITAFAVYNSVRYFLAFTVYESVGGQVASLLLGISTAAVFALTVCSIVVWLFQPYLLVHHVPSHFLLRTRTIFHSAASLALFAPAVVNTVLLFVWKNNPITELNIRRRCHVDIDVIWSVSSEQQCKPPAWDVWIVLSILRLVITTIVIILYHWIAAKYTRVHLSSLSRSRWNRTSLESSSSESYFSPRLPSITGPSFANPVRPPLRSHHHSSESTLHSQPHSKNSSNGLSFHSVAENPIYADEYHLASAGPETAEVALDDYYEHFRQLIFRVARETDEAIALAAAETPDIAETEPESYADADADAASSNLDFHRPRIPPAVGYDEFGRPYRPDEHVPIMNSYVRRMPTIESMGSREVASSIYSRTGTMTASVRSSLLLGRPLTRANTLDSTMGSRRSSRTNGAAAGAGVDVLFNVARTTEVGELGEKSGRATSIMSSGSSYPSTSTTSYHTATSHGSTMSSDFRK
ncbi:hypothetical protein C0993_005452 [Termitomyces sp. T159_Od127]|nr:hypothetical protein C0993_005452 [Termitomyces sp. T159_Od127]